MIHYEVNKPYKIGKIKYVQNRIKANAQRKVDIRLY